jgi:hypothetical protein
MAATHIFRKEVVHNYYVRIVIFYMQYIAECCRDMDLAFSSLLISKLRK